MGTPGWCHDLILLATPPTQHELLQFRNGILLLQLCIRIHFLIMQLYCSMCELLRKTQRFRKSAFLFPIIVGE
jgi:hypothetical protein